MKYVSPSQMAQIHEGLVLYLYHSPLGLTLLTLDECTLIIDTGATWHEIKCAVQKIASKGCEATFNHHISLR